MSMVFDGNKKRLGVSDIYPEAVKLKKGTYTIRCVFLVLCVFGVVRL